MKKRYLTALIIMAILTVTAFVPSAAYALDAPVIVLDGRVRVYDQEPFIEEGRTLVPMRGIFEDLGAEILWDPDTKAVTANRGDTVIILVIGSRTAYVDGRQILLEVPPKIVNDRTFVPLRFVSEAVGAAVEWEPLTRTIYINSSSGTGSNGEVTGAKTVQEVAEESKSVVMITTFDYTGNELATGSGFAVSDDMVITNYHVIDGAYSAMIWLEDGRSLEVLGVVEYDPDRDVALMKISRKVLRPVVLGESAGLKLGEQVVAIGSPVGLTNTVSDGIISSLNRSVDGFNYIQTTAPISVGSSGGALFNMRGEVIGITTAMYAGGQNLNLAIPIDEVKDIIRDGDYQEMPISDTSEPAVAYTEFADMLLRDMGAAAVGSNTVAFDGAWAVESDDSTTVLMQLTMDDANYLKLLMGLEEGAEDDFKEWLTDIVNYTEQVYPDKHVLGEVLFRGIFESYPESFPEESITASPYGSGWWVSYRILYFYDDDEWVYFEWNDE